MKTVRKTIIFLSFLVIACVSQPDSEHEQLFPTLENQRASLGFKRESQLKTFKQLVFMMDTTTSIIDKIFKSENSKQPEHYKTNGETIWSYILQKSKQLEDKKSIGDFENFIFGFSLVKDFLGDIKAHQQLIKTLKATVKLLSHFQGMDIVFMKIKFEHDFGFPMEKLPGFKSDVDLSILEKLEKDEQKELHRKKKFAQGYHQGRMKDMGSYIVKANNDKKEGKGKGKEKEEYF